MIESFRAQLTAIHLQTGALLLQLGVLEAIVTSPVGDAAATGDEEGAETLPIMPRTFGQPTGE